MELAWRDTRFVSDSPPQRACLRACVARRGGIHCLLTYEFWCTDEAGGDEVWYTVLETLVLGG